MSATIAPEICPDARAVLEGSIGVMLLRSAVELEASRLQRAPLTDAQLQVRSALVLRLRSLAKDLLGFTGEVVAATVERGEDPDQTTLAIADERARRHLFAPPNHIAAAQADGVPGYGL